MTRAEDEPTIWEKCKVCALQMVGGPRCTTHNPTPEQRVERGLPAYVRPRPSAPPTKQTRKRK